MTWLAAGVFCGSIALQAQGTSHGVPAPVSESRGVIATADAQGRPRILVLTPNRSTGERPVGSLLMIDAQSGTVEEIPYPESCRGRGSNFGLMLAANGRLYTGFGPLLVEFDPERKAFTWETRLSANPGHALAWGEDAAGTIYAGFFNSCSVVALNPVRREVRDLGKLDSKEKFVYSLHADDAGWLYAGIGNAKSNLVAYHLASGERRQLADEAHRGVGAGILRRGADGHVYGKAGVNAPHWLRLHNGTATPVEGTPEVREYPAMAWQKTYSRFPDGSRLADFDLPNTSYTLITADGTRTQHRFEYVGCGANITAMKGAPDGRVYGSTSHPFRLFSVAADSGQRTDHGGVNAVRGGNIRGLVWHEGVVYGADYSGGRFWAFDTRKPWNDSGQDDANPRALGAYAAELGRPRTMLLHPDGNSIIWSGMAGYGYAYGGMGFYDTRSGEITILPNEQLLPGLSCITLRALPDGNLVGGTTITAGFGHNAGVQTAEVFVMDYEQRRVIKHLAPVPGAAAIQCVAVTADGLICGLTNRADLFLLDPRKDAIGARMSLTEYGSILGPDQALFTHRGRLYALVGTALLDIRTSPAADSIEVRQVTELPATATAGTGVVQDRVFYAAGAEVWSIPLPRE